MLHAALRAAGRLPASGADSHCDPGAPMRLARAGKPDEAIAARREALSA
jgi:hypothetical protein